jgi:hypothetical protein
MFQYKDKNLRAAFDDKTRNSGSLIRTIPLMTSLSEMAATFVKSERVPLGMLQTLTGQEELKLQVTKGFCSKLWFCNTVIMRLMLVTV